VDISHNKALRDTGLLLRQLTERDSSIVVHDHMLFRNSAPGDHADFLAMRENIRVVSVRVIIVGIEA